MNQTTVERVAGWLAESTGKDVSSDWDSIVGLINDVRRLAYSKNQILEQAKPAFVCVPVQQFSPECTPGCCGMTGAGATWSGVTLPAWALQPSMIYSQGKSMPYASRWMAYEDDGTGARFPYTFEDMGDTYVFERSTGMNEPFVLSLMATKCSGEQHVTISYLNEFDKTVTEDILLRPGKWVTAGQKVKSVLPSGVRLPLDLRSPVKVRAGDGVTALDVAQWDPGIDVPAFRRIKVNVCWEPNRVVAAQVLRRFRNVWDKHDIVEHDNRMAWVAGANFVRTSLLSKKDQAEIANAMFDSNLFTDFIMKEAEAEQTGKRLRAPIATSFNSIPYRHGRSFY